MATKSQPVRYWCERTMKIGHDEDTDEPIMAYPGEEVTDQIKSQRWPWHTIERMIQTGWITKHYDQARDAAAVLPGRPVKEKVA